MSRWLMGLRLAGAVLAGALGSVAPALGSWTTNGPGTFAGTAPASIAVAVENSSGTLRAAASCASTMAGSLKASQASGVGIGTFLPTFTNCFSLAGPSVAMKCGSMSLSAISFTAPVAAISLSSVQCDLVMPYINCGNATTVSGGIVATGTLTGTYNNTVAAFTIPNNSYLSATWPAGCVMPPHVAGDTARFASVGNPYARYNVSSSFRPLITNP
jgi:hypothetical protein